MRTSSLCVSLKAILTASVETWGEGFFIVSRLRCWSDTEKKNGPFDRPCNGNRADKERTVMNKLMFAASGVAIGALMAGCSTSTPVTYKTVDAQGREHSLQVTDSAGQAVTVESAARESIEKTLPRLKGLVERGLREKAAQKKFFTKYQIPSDAEIRKTAGRALTDADLKVLRAAAENFTRDFEKTVVWPAWIENIRQKVMPLAEAEVAKKNYEKARELIWCAAAIPVPEVSEGVREFGIEFLNTRVNPVQWKEIESDLRGKTAAFVEKGAFDEAFAFLKDYPRIRTYSTRIDERLAAVQQEVVRLGVDAKGVEPIRQKTGELVAAAAKIVDVRDSVTNAVVSVTKKSDTEKDLDLEEYERKLEDYRKTLVRYNCTEENAQKIVETFKASVAPLLAALKKESAVEAQTDAKSFTFLGTMAVNRRIDKVTAELVKVVRKEQIAASVVAMKAKAAQLLVDGQFEEAREAIWQAAATGDAELDAEVFAAGVVLLRQDVNPAQWIAIEAEIKATVSEKVAADDYDAALEFLKSYPKIRQHSALLDSQLARVREEAEVLGVSPAEAEKHAQAACALVAEAAKLVDHLDEAKPGEMPSEEDKAAYEKALADYRAKLALYHAEPAKVDEIVGKLDAALRALMRKPGEPSVKLVLGTNAVNDRLAKLVAEQVALVEKKKAEWQAKQFDAQYAALIRRVREAVAANDYLSARAAIRDERLVGVPTADAKLYALRVGLLDSVVNPRQLAYQLAQIRAKSKALADAKDFAGLKAFVLSQIDEKDRALVDEGDFVALAVFVAGYPYVHDTYEQIQASLEGVKSTMKAMSAELPEEVADDYIAKVDKLIAALLDGRQGRWSPDFDFKALEAALEGLSKSLVAQYYQQEEVKAFCEKAKSDIRELLDAQYKPLTTAEVNAKLAEVLCPLLAVAEAGLQEQEYLALLAKIDQDVSMDAQIAMAEEAIARQLGIACDKASFKVNAVLGEYARAFRLLKRNATLNPSEATSLLLGAAYLDQPAVIPYALKLGADVNGVSKRDVRKRTALMLAIDAQNLSLLKALVEAGASSVATDADGNAVLHYAVKSGSVSAVRAIAKAAPMTVVNAAGETPLFEAVKRNQQTMAQTVIDLVEKDGRAAFVNTADKSGLTAFALAAKIGARDVLEPLAKAGATYSEKDLILAEEGDHVAVAQWLVAQGADVNAEGVMAKACPKTATGRYLIHEGGVGSHVCETCKPPEEKPAAAVEPQKKVEAAGTITFKVADTAAK